MLDGGIRTCQCLPVHVSPTFLSCLSHPLSSKVDPMIIFQVAQKGDSIVYSVPDNQSAATFATADHMLVRFRFHESA
jgi:hypothetical protein